MKKIDIHLLRAMYTSESFGISGNLTSDILEQCRKMRVSVNVLDSSAGITVTGRSGNYYLFGGTKNTSVITVEMISTKERLSIIKQKILKMLENKKDNIMFYEVPAEGYIFDENLEYPPSI